jgi:Putative MetA-pathway of phenol degradation
MRTRVAIKALVFIALILHASALPSAVRAQQMPYIGTPITGLNQGPPPADNSPLGQSTLSFIDSAVPQNNVRLRFDMGYHVPRPTRAEFFQAKGGLPFSPGLPLPETSINSFQELTAYFEFAPAPFFSTFIETPYRWLNPEINRNTNGVGDVNFGFKLCTWHSEDFLGTLQLRIYNPTASSPGLGTDHWTIEPAFLGMWRPFDNIVVEADVRYIAPLGGTDFAGDVLRYGAGLSLGQATPQGFWFKPAIEAVGWTVRGGKEMVVTSPDTFFVQGSSGKTIVNAYAGVRVGLGATLDCYAGYGRCLTGSSWSRDFARIEFRFFY